MALQPVQLDDLNWSQLAAAARDRIAAASRGRWTLHAPVDPGVTLLELFAAQLEQRLYMMDQMPPAIQAALLELLGVAPRPAQIARTVVCFREPANGTDPAEAVPAQQLPSAPAHAVLRCTEGEPPLRFSTVHDVTVLPVAAQTPSQRGNARTAFRPHVSLYVQGEDRTADLAAGRTTCLFAAAPSDVVTEIVFWLARPIPPDAHGWVALFFDLDTPRQIDAQWTDDAPGDLPCRCPRRPGATPDPQDNSNPDRNRPPPPGAFTWEFGPVTASVPVRHVDDGTQGFRRSGIVRLALPDQAPWQSGATRPLMPPKPGCIPYTVRIHAVDPPFSFLPRVKRILPNAAIARHAFRVTPDDADMFQLREQILDWRPLGDNRLRLIDTMRPPIARPSSARDDGFQRDDTRHLPSCPRHLTRTLTLRFAERNVPSTNPEDWPSWTPVDRLDHLGPHDRRFLVDRDAGELIFGDGLTGRIPIPRSTSDDLPMHPGATGWLVELLQRTLNHKVHPAPDLVVDGDFGPATEAAVMRFQTQAALNADGVVNEPTWSALGTPDVRLTLDVGGGAAGNVGPDREWTLLDTALTAGNVVAGRGGAEPESLDAAARRAAAAGKRRNRTVTEQDLAELARRAPATAVARARVIVGRHPDYPFPVPGAATVYLVPDLPPTVNELEDACGDDLVALRPEPATLEAVARHLDKHRLLTQEIYVRPAEYRDVELAVEIAGHPFDPDALRRDVCRALRRHTHPVFGRRNHDPWPFGATLRPSELLHVAQQAVGDQLTVTRVAVRIHPLVECHAAPRQPDCTPARSDVSGAAPDPSARAPGLCDKDFIDCDECESQLRLEPQQLPALRRVHLRFTVPRRPTGGLL